jgi:hypothetical protein
MLALLPALVLACGYEVEIDGHGMVPGGAKDTLTPTLEATTGVPDAAPPVPLDAPACDADKARPFLA